MFTTDEHERRIRLLAHQCVEVDPQYLVERWSDDGNFSSSLKVKMKPANQDTPGRLME